MDPYIRHISTLSPNTAYYMIKTLSPFQPSVNKYAYFALMQMLASQAWLILKAVLHQSRLLLDCLQQKCPHHPPISKTTITQTCTSKYSKHIVRFKHPVICSPFIAFIQMELFQTQLAKTDCQTVGFHFYFGSYSVRAMMGLERRFHFSTV